MGTALTCCTNLWRILFLILNAIFAVVGLALVGLGGYLVASNNSLEFITGNQYASGGTLIIISGIVTFFIALIGIVGAAGSWPAVLVFYIILILVVIILEIVTGVLGFVYRNDLERFASNRALSAIEQYEANSTNDITSVIDFMQNTFMCCGYNTYEDWSTSSYMNMTGRFPDSCNCTLATGTSCLQFLVGNSSQAIYNRNCSGSVRNFLEANLVIVGAVGISFAVLELIGLVISIALCCCFCAKRFHKEDEYDTYNHNRAV